MQCAFENLNKNFTFGNLLAFTDGILQPKLDVLNCCKGTYSIFDQPTHSIRFCQTKSTIGAVNRFLAVISDSPELHEQVLSEFLRMPVDASLQYFWGRHLGPNDTNVVFKNILLEIFRVGESIGVYSTSKPTQSVDKLQKKFVVIVNSPATDIAGLEKLDFLIGHAYREMIAIILFDLSTQQTQTRNSTSDFQKKILKKFSKPIFHHLSRSTLAKLAEICER